MGFWMWVVQCVPTGSCEHNTAETIIFSPPVNSVHHPNYINFVNGICQHFYNIVISLRLFQILSANEVEDGLGCGEGYNLAIQSTTIMTSTVVQEQTVRVKG